MTHWELSANSDLKLLDSANVVSVLVLLGKPSPDFMHMPRIRTHTLIKTLSKVYAALLNTAAYLQLDYILSGY